MICDGAAMPDPIPDLVIQPFGATAWFYNADGEPVYLLRGAEVDRETLRAYLIEHPELTSGRTKWEEELP